MDEIYPPLPKAKSSRVMPPTPPKTSRWRTSWRAVNGTSPEVRIPFRQSDYRNAQTCLTQTNEALEESVFTVISPDGDIILQYNPTSYKKSASKPDELRFQWLVSSERVTQNSPYFAALLAPDKFAEGRKFSNEKQRLDQASFPTGDPMSTAEEHLKENSNQSNRGSSQLPLVDFGIGRPLGRHTIVILDLFLKALCFYQQDSDDDCTLSLHKELRQMSLALVAGLIEVADQFNSTNAVRDTLQRSGYEPSIKSRSSLSSFNASMLKFSEERIRQLIYIARFIGHADMFKIFTHTLVLLGSASWEHGLESFDPDAPQWSYLPAGVEEELYYRRQSVLNTITDLQAYFLRLYGGVDDQPEVKRPPSTAPTLGMPSAPVSVSASKDKPFQCRCGLSNSQACDAFHLGQMTRFLTIRTKTVFMGSTLINADFEEEENSSEEDEYRDNDSFNSVNGDTGKLDLSPRPRKRASSFPGDIISIIASLRQIPDYQIDSNHTGCGIRRRLLPALDCIERFTSDSRALLGLILPSWDPISPPPINLNSWRNKKLMRAPSVDVRHSKLLPMRSSAVSNNTTVRPEYLGAPLEDARLLFTARKRNWEA